MNEKIVDLIFRGLIVLIGKVGVDFIFYETVEEIYRRLEMPNIYRERN